MKNLSQHANHIDLSLQLPSEPLAAEIVIVGSGAGGGVAAEILASAGLNVLMIEEGPLKTSSDFVMKESVAYPDLYQESASRRTKDKGISVLQGRSVGGSTTVNWTSSFRTPEKTLNYWRDNFGVTGLGQDDLTPWFELMERRLNVAPWELPPNANNKVLQRGAELLGWKTRNIPRNVKNCANLGYCGMGCPLNAKQSMLVTTIPAALNAGMTLISRARCDAIITDNNQVKRIVVRAMDSFGQPTEKQITITTEHLILSGGAIGTPALMIRSGLVDPYQQIGKRTYLHPVTGTFADMPEPIEPYSGAPQSIYSDEFLWRDGVSGKMGYKLEVPPIHPVLGSTIIPMHGNEHYSAMRGLKHMNSLLALMRDGFHERSLGGTVELDKYQAPVLDYPLNDYLWEAATHSMLRMAELQFAAGAKKVYPLHMDLGWISSWREAEQKISNVTQQLRRTALFSAHVMGGANMGSNPENSVVNSQGKYHHLDNLWVMDGALFPTSLGVNPQLSIFGLVAKLASGMLEQLQSSHR